jgi:hypothetical protein
MQRKVEIPAVGIWPALRAAILPLAKKYRAEAVALIAAAGPRQRPATVAKGRGVPVGEQTAHRISDAESLESLLENLAILAVEPGGTIARECFPAGYLLQFYIVAPNLTLAVLQTARAVWFKKSKAQFLWRWLASNEGIRALPHQPPKSVWELSDKELLTACEAAHPAKQVRLADVQKARTKLAKDILNGRRLKAHW